MSLDETSRAIGDLEASVRSLGDSFDRHCNDDDRRHAENIKALRDNTDAVQALAARLAPIADSVSVMRPVVDGYQITKARLAAWASAGFVVIVVVGWIVEAALKWAVESMLSHFHG
jgi:hypothetical protein